MTGHHIAALAPGPADTAFASGEIEMRNCLGKDSLFPLRHWAHYAGRQRVPAGNHETRQIHHLGAGAHLL